VCFIGYYVLEGIIFNSDQSQENAVTYHRCISLSMAAISSSATASVSAESATDKQTNRETDRQTDKQTTETSSQQLCSSGQMHQVVCLESRNIHQLLCYYTILQPKYCCWVCETPFDCGAGLKEIKNQRMLNNE